MGSAVTLETTDAGPASWRCFVALEISETVRAAAARLQAAFRRTGADLSLPDPAQLHVTLLFLGHTLTGRVDEVRRAMDVAGQGIPAFDLHFQGVGCFGPPRHPRVVWAGVSGPPANLLELPKRILAGITEPWFTIDRQAFRPHLTLGRIRSGRGLDGLTTMMASHKEDVLGCSPVRRILLMRSHLDQPGPKYSVLHETPLKGA